MMNSPRRARGSIWDGERGFLEGKNDGKKLTNPIRKRREDMEVERVGV